MMGLAIILLIVIQGIILGLVLAVKMTPGGGASRELAGNPGTSEKVVKWGFTFTPLLLAFSLPVMCSTKPTDAPRSASPDTYSAADTQRQIEAASKDNAKIGAEMNLKRLLKDADAVKYRDVVLSRIEGGNLMLCGKVNSKNSFGAYTGFKRFIASPNPDAPTLIEGEPSGLGADVDRSFGQAYVAVCSNPVERY